MSGPARQSEILRYPVWDLVLGLGPQYLVLARSLATLVVIQAFDGL